MPARISKGSARLRWGPRSAPVSLSMTTSSVWGTAGAMVHDKKDPSLHFLLSAAHVMRGTGHDVIQPAQEGTPPGHNSTHDERAKSRPIIRDYTGGTAKLAFGGIDAQLAEVPNTSPTIIGLGGPMFPKPHELGLWCKSPA